MITTITCGEPVPRTESAIATDADILGRCYTNWASLLRLIESSVFHRGLLDSGEYINTTEGK